MTHLPEALSAWETSAFAAVLKSEVERLKAAALPLQAGLTHGSYVSGSRFEAMVIDVADAGDRILVRLGIHYRSIIAGCSCADDPTPVDELVEYCEIAVEIDKASAAARFTLLGD